MARYSAKLAEHFHAPRNAGALADANAVGQGSLDGGAPYSTIYLRIGGELVKQAAFKTFGCGVSIACGSVLTELAIGKTVCECEQLTAQDVIEALDGLPEEKLFCASVAVDGLRNALAEWRKQQGPVEFSHER